MNNIFIQYNLSSDTDSFFYAINNNNERKNLSIVVCDSNYNIPITVVSLDMYPGIKYWFASQDVGYLIYHPKFTGFRYLLIDNETGIRSEIESGLPKIKDVEITLPDKYLLGDSFATYFNCLYTDKLNYLFEKDYDGWFIDLGANLGSYTCLALKKGVKKCLLVEPSSQLCDSLSSTFSDFGEIIIEQAAITNSLTDKVSFNLNEAAQVCNSVSDSGQISVNNFRISELVKKYNIDKISLLKIDIEGMEYEVVEGIEDWVFNITSSISLETHLFVNIEDSILVDKIVSHGFNHILVSESESHKEHFFFK